MITLEQVQSFISGRLQQIEEILPDYYRLTLIARCTNSDFKDADIILTRDDLNKVVVAIQRLKDKE